MTPDRMFADALYAALLDCKAIEFAPIASPKLAPAPAPALTLRISHFGGRHEQWHIHLLPPLLLALGDPQRLDIRREGGALVLVPVETGGWAVTQGAYTRRLCCNKAAPLIGGMVGQYRVAVDDGRAVVGEKL